MDFRLPEKTTYIALIAILVIVAGCTTQSNNMGDGSMRDNSMMDAVDVTFKLDGGNYYFELDGQRAPELRVRQGDKVRIELRSVEGFHDWVVDEFDAATERVRETDGTAYVEFVADQRGTFEYYCSVGSHRANGMVGTLIVE